MDVGFFAAVLAVPVGIVVYATRRALRQMDEAYEAAERWTEDGRPIPYPSGQVPR